MKNLIEKIGMDKIAHFAVGGLVSYFFSTLILMQEGAAGDWMNVAVCTAGALIASAAGFFKEAVADEKPDWKDFFATVAGACVPYISVGLGTLFNLLLK